MADAIWTAPAVNWAETKVKDSGQVKVTTLHWRCSLTEDIYTAGSYGTTGDDGNRVYPLPALEAVPESVVIGWIHQALGEEEVARIEQSLADQIIEQKTPTSGTVVPQ